MMCVEVGESPAEGEHDQPNSEVNLEVTSNLEAQLEQSLSLQEWIDSKHQSSMTEAIMHK